ncbi:hypothetical protein GGS21DRAFT_487412 [Xylaria nigripes]|nr:hypothetical protein GGS21DRAFT_487412 [Xylaria nigripes]
MELVHVLDADPETPCIQLLDLVKSAVEHDIISLLVKSDDSRGIKNSDMSYDKLVNQGAKITSFHAMPFYVLAYTRQTYPGMFDFKTDQDLFDAFANA